MALNEILAPGRITRAAPAIEDIRDNAGQWPAISRIPFVPAENGEILARVSARITAGDIYPDGSPAVVKSEPPMTLVPVAITNFKRATPLTATDLDLITRIINGDRNPSLFRTFGEYIGRRVRNNRMGNYMRVEQVMWGMMLDSYSFDGGGMKTGTVTWGKPSDLKVTPGTLWSNAGASTPITDISDLKQVATDKYGVTYDRLTMSTAAFNLLVATTQFRNHVGALNLAFNVEPNSIPPASNTGVMKQLVERIIGMEVELVDHTIQIEALAGSVSGTRYLPANKVILSRKSDDGNEATWDFANGTVLEAMHAAIAGVNGGGSMVGGGFGGDMIRGPVTFAVTDNHFTSTEIHDVIRGFPRCHNTAATAVLTVSA